LYSTYGDEVQFFLVYIREAHPVDGWQVARNESEGVLFQQPASLEERTEVCTKMCQKLNITLPTLIDRLDDKVNRAYNAAPDRLYLVGRDGRIAFQGDRGPRGFRPIELEAAIKKELPKK